MARNLPKSDKSETELAEDQIESAITEVQVEMQAEMDARENTSGTTSDARDSGVELPSNSTDLDSAIASSLSEAVTQAAISVPDEPGANVESPLPRSGPANDDRASVGSMIYSLQRQPAKTPYWAALLISSVWLISGLTYGWVILRDEMTAISSLRDYLASPALLTLTTVVIVPILFFFVLAVLVRRAQGLRLVAQSMTEVAARLAEPEGVAKDAVASVGQAVRREVAAMGDGVERALARAGELEALVHGEVSALERAYGDNEIRIKGLVEELVSERETIKTHSQALREQISTSHEGFNTDIDNVTQRIAAAITTAGDQLTETMELRAAQITSAISSTGDNVSETLLARGTNLVESLAGKANEISETLDKSTTDIFESFESRKAELTEDLSQAGTAIAEIMGTRNVELSETLIARTSEMGQQLQQYSAEVVGTISNAGAEVGNALSNTMGKAQEMLVQHNAKVGETLGAHSEELNNRLDAQAGRINEVLGERSTEISHTLARAGGELLNNLNSRGNEINANLTQSLGSIDNTLATRGVEVADRFASQASQLEDSMSRQIESVGTTLSDRAGEMNNLLLSRIGEMSQVIDSGGSGLVNSLSAKTEEISKTFASKSGELTASLASNSSELTASLASNSSELTALLTAKTGELDQTLVNHAEALGARISTISKTGDAVARAIEQKGSEASKGLALAGAEIVQNISAKTGDISQHLTSTGAELTRKMVEHGEQVVEAMMTTDQGVAKNFTEVVSRLSGANKDLQDVLASAGDHLTAIEQGLGDRADTFRTTIESATNETASTSARMETQVLALQEVSGIVLKDISQLSSRFEDQGKALSAAAEAVSDSNSRMDTALRERHESLANLTTSLSQKAEDVDTMMRTYTGIVEDSLATAEARAREIGALLGDSAAQSSQTIRDEFERMNSTTGAENESALSAIRTQHITMRDEIAQVIGDTRAGFEDMTREMHNAVRQISQDLDSTREELRRNAIELPRETEEQANAMRRMVSDQIRALDELSTIVTRHGGGLDTSRAAPAQPIQTAEPTPRPPLRQQQPAQGNTSSRLEAARRVVSALPEESGRPGEQGSDWSMQELLARASERDKDSHPNERDQGNGDDRFRLHTMESLNSISVDLARALDHEAPGDLWNRYKSGERNVFTRRLYNIRGQRTFDDIRRKYTSENEFRSAVDRYVDEFEVMIKDVEDKDRDNMLTQTYMTSDTGKVYLMLAHASGRFD